MTVKRTPQEKAGIYFITLTCTDWLPLIGMASCCYFNLFFFVVL
jgi:hypothetical protein